MIPLNALSPHQAFKVKDNEDVWVFAYGSLMWNPEFIFEDMKPAHVCGYHRRFCLKCLHFRGTPAQPGLVLGLDRGGSCRGVAFKIAPQHLTAALNSLWEREMGNSDAYLPRRVPVVIDNDLEQKVMACVFVCNPQSGHYLESRCRKTAAGIIRDGQGIRGSNFEYLERTVKQLRDLNIHDAQIEDIYKHALQYSTAPVEAS